MGMDRLLRMGSGVLEREMIGRLGIDSLFVREGGEVGPVLIGWLSG
jgi:hypothetical protein